MVKMARKLRVLFRSYTILNWCGVSTTEHIDVLCDVNARMAFQTLWLNAQENEKSVECVAEFLSNMFDYSFCSF